MGMPSPGQHGFTLVELAIVLAVIAVVAVPSAMYFLSFQQAQALNGAAAQMVNALNQARQLAITSSTSYRVDFDTTSNKVRFVRPANCSTSCAPWAGPGTDSTGWRTLENSARIACAPGSSSPITFDYLGTATSGTVEVMAATGTAARYVIVGTTGRVRSSSTGTCP